MIKHAHTEAASVVIDAHEEEVSVKVTDDGAGFDPKVDHPGHLGLRSMGERAALLGGGVKIRTAPGAGTTISVTVPAAARESLATAR